MTTTDKLLQTLWVLTDGKDISLMGHYLAEQLESPTAVAIIPAMQVSYWVVTVATVVYSIWRYLRQSREA
jgi:hypothetical protein